MATLASDNFNRANAGTLGANWIANLGNWGVVSNQASMTTDDSLSCYDAGITWPNDQWSQCTTITPSTVINGGPGPTVRTASSGDTAYGMWAGSVDGISVQLANAGSFSTLSSTAATTVASGDVIYLEIQGSALVAKKNGATISALSVSNSTLTAGKPGLAGGDGGVTLVVDNWSGGDFSVAATTTVWTSIVRGPTPGKSAGVAPHSGRFYQSPRASNATSTSNVTTGLSGQSATFAAGTLAPSTTVALTGQAATFSAGTLAPSTTVALTGQGATFAAGTITAAPTVTMSGQAATFATGSLSPATSVALLGQSATFAAGTVSAAGDVTVNLSGQAATFSAGTLSPSTTVALTGQSASFTAGNVLAAPTVALTGQSASFAQGTIGPQTTVTLSGQNATFSAGNLIATPTSALSGQAATFGLGALAPQTSVTLAGQSATFSAGNVQVLGDVTVALTGAAAVFAAGTIIASGGDQPSTAQAGTGRGTPRVRSTAREIETALTRSVDELRPAVEPVRLADLLQKREIPRVIETVPDVKRYDAEIALILWMLM